MKNFKLENFRMKDGIVTSQKIDGKWKRLGNPMTGFAGTSTAARISRYAKDAESWENVTRQAMAKMFAAHGFVLAGEI